MRLTSTMLEILNIHHKNTQEGYSMYIHDTTLALFANFIWSREIAHVKQTVFRHY